MDSSSSLSSSQINEIIAAHPSAAKSALEAPSDDALRVPCYCEENVWRLTFRKLWSFQQEQQQLQQNGCTTASSSSRFYVLFVSNPNGCVPMFQQLASSRRDKPIFWDYHVILLEECSASSNTTRIWDIDCHLECPCSFQHYVEEVFFRHEQWLVHYQPFFRVVEALTFLRYFSSDRSHMINEQGEWSAPPPAYDCIVKNHGTSKERGVVTQEAAVDAKQTHQHTLHEYMTIFEDDALESSGIFDWEETGNREGGNEARNDKTSRHLGVVCSLPQLRQRFGRFGK